MKTKKRSMSDTAVAAKTGKTWPQWFDVLDKAGAKQMEHRAIATLLFEKHRVPGWWAQMVTVEYERARGIREVHQTKEGYVANVARTLDAAPATLYRAWIDAATRRKWLGIAQLTITTATPGKSLRIKFGDGTRVDVAFYARGKTRCQITVQHRKLERVSDVAAMKKYWGAALDRLKKMAA